MQNKIVTMNTIHDANVQNLPQPLILFDGVCNLCSASVQFIIENDANSHFSFASLQSPTGQMILKAFNRPLDEFDSVILLENDRLYTQSTAACRIATQFSSNMRYLSYFRLLPKGLRDWGYDLISQNRYRFWGKKNQCWLPTPELSNRFL